MKACKYVIVLFLITALTSCQSKKNSKPAHFRILSTIQYASAKLTIQGKNKNNNVQKNLSLKYAEPTEYLQLPAGYYDVTLSVNGKDLLKGTYVIGKNSYYTLLAMGLLPEKWKVNPQTTSYKLKHIFAGEEFVSTNKYMPQWFMMRDNYDGSLKSAYIRFVNANPKTGKLTIKKGNKSLISGLAYPVESGMLKLKPGHHNLHILYGKILVGEKKIAAKPGYIYTAVITNKENTGSKLGVRILKNPSRTLINQHK